MTMTRCAVRPDFGPGSPRVTGLAFVAGRDYRHAELAAAFDALLQHPRFHAEVAATLIGPVESRLARERQATAAEVAQTRVDFFTLVREQG